PLREGAVEGGEGGRALLVDREGDRPERLPQVRIEARGAALQGVEEDVEVAHGADRRAEPAELPVHRVAETGRQMGTEEARSGARRSRRSRTRARGRCAPG